MRGGKRAESLVRYGDFTGTIDDLIEHLGSGSRGSIQSAVYAGRMYRGKQIQKIGTVKHCALYALKKDGLTVDTGTAKELSERYFVSRSVFSDYANTGGRLNDMYNVERIGSIDIVEEEK